MIYVSGQPENIIAVHDRVAISRVKLAMQDARALDKVGQDLIWAMTGETRPIIRATRSSIG